MLKLQAEWAGRSAKRLHIARKGIMAGVQRDLDEKLKLQVADAECRRCRDLKICTSKSCNTRKFRVETVETLDLLTEFARSVLSQARYPGADKSLVRIVGPSRTSKKYYSYFWYYSTTIITNIIEMGPRK